MVITFEQGVLNPGGAITKQLLTPEHIAQQVSIENQQLGPRRSGLVFPGQLALSDCADVGVAGVALLTLDKMPHVLADQQSTKSRMNMFGQPAFATGFRPSEHQYLHALASARSRRQVSQPLTAKRVNSP